MVHYHRRSTDVQETPTAFFKRTTPGDVLVLIGILTAVFIAFFNLKGDVREIRNDVAWLKDYIRNSPRGNEHLVKNP